MSDPLGVASDALHDLGKKISPDHPDAALLGAATIGVGVVLAVATRGRIFGTGAGAVERAAGLLPELEVCAGTAGRAAGQIGTLESAAGLAIRAGTQLPKADAAAGLVAEMTAHLPKADAVTGLTNEVLGHLPGATNASAGEAALARLGDAAHQLEHTTADSAAGLNSLTQQTFGGRITEKTAQLSWKATRKVLSLLGKSGEGDAAVVASDELRRTVFNRFLNRLDQERYVLHGSYGLESQQFIARKAVKDLDLLALDPAIVRGSREATNSALVEDLRAMMRKPVNDGLTFEIPALEKEAPHISVMYPRMRHALAIAKSTTDGQEILRIPLDIRVGAGTILPPTREALAATSHGASYFPIMAPEETFAHKLFSYTNRTIGGIERKPKDLLDMAGMVQKGLDEQKVTQALQSWTQRGYSMGAFRHPSETLGASLERNLGAQTVEQLDANFQTVQNYYARIAPKVEAAPLFDEVSQTPLARLSRYLQKQFVVYPAG